MFFNFNSIEQISPELAAEEIKNPGVTLMDVREVAEYQQARIAGCKLYPTSLLMLKENELDQFKDTTIIVYCHVGNRSLQVSKWLDKKGFKVKNMTGGIVNWVQSGLPIDSGK